METKGNWSYFAPNINMTLSKEKLNASAAEEFCVKHGGHLASVGSQEENNELVGRNEVWLGGRRKHSCKRRKN